MAARRPAGLARAAGLAARGALLAASAASAASAQDGGTDACARAGAGRIATIARLVRNPDSAAVVLLPEVTLPAGWRLALGGEPLALRARGATTWVVGALAPAGARAGDHRFAFRLRPTAGAGAPGAAADSGVLCVHVPVHEAAEVRVEPHGVLVAGDSARIAVVVRNTGNVGARLRVDASGVVGFARAAPETPVRVRVGVGELALQPGDSALVGVDVLTHRTLPRSGTLRLRVEARPVAAGSDRAVASGTRELLVVPPAGRGLRRAPRLPLRVALRAGGGRAVAPAEVAGEGAVGGGVRVELLARGPSPVTSPIGERSEYRLDVADATRRLTLGDQTFALSPLLERGHGAFGAQARAQAGRVGLQAFAGRNRWWRAGGTEAGARAAVRLGGGLLALHALDRRGSPRDDGTAASLAGTFGTERGRIEIETAGAHAGGRSHARGRPAWAARAHATGRVAGAAYDVELSQAGASFPGYLRGAGTLAAEVRRAAGHADLSLGARQDRVGGGTLVTPELGVGALVLPRERRRALTAEARLFGAAALTLRAADRVGRAGALDYDGSERSAAVELARRLGPVGVAVDAAWGLRDDRRRATRSPFERTGARLDLTVDSRVSARVFADRERGATLWSSAALSTTLGVDLALAAPGGRTRLTLSGYASSRQALYDGAIPVDGTVRARQLDATLERGLAWGQSLGARVRLASTDALLRGLGAQQSRLAYLEYRVPIGARLPAMRGVPDLRVRVVDGATRRPIGGALVRRGEDVGVTTRDGLARLPGGGDGIVELLATPAVAGYAVADGDGLRVATPRSGRAALVTLALVPRAHLRGVATLGDSGAAAGARVMLASARDTLFLTTDASGAFDAGAVPPGRWHLAATGSPSESARVFATDSLDVAPGGEVVARLTLRPRARGIRPLQVTAAPPEVAPAPPTGSKRRPDRARRRSRH